MYGREGRSRWNGRSPAAGLAAAALACLLLLPSAADAAACSSAAITSSPYKITYEPPSSGSTNHCFSVTATRQCDVADTCCLLPVYKLKYIKLLGAATACTRGSAKRVNGGIVWSSDGGSAKRIKIVGSDIQFKVSGPTRICLDLRASTGCSSIETLCKGKACRFSVVSAPFKRGKGPKAQCCMSAATSLLPCSSQNGGCSPQATCANSELDGSRTCTCNQGYTGDGFNCTSGPVGANPQLPTGPLYVGYFQAWSSPWTGVGANMDLANIPSYVNIVVVAFAKPDCTYTKGSYSLWPSTGVSFSSDGTVVRDAISTLKARHPNTRVLLAVGGATYTNFAGLNVQCLKDVVTDFGFDGIDLDWEPSSPSCSISGGKVTCPTDTESVNAVTALRTAFPKGQYILSAASFHVGCYGEGTYAASQPITSYTGINLAMARSTAGQALDLVNLMSYDAGNLQTTGYDPKEAYRATSAAWPNAAVALGVEVPPEGGGSTNVITLAQVDDYATYVKSQGGAGMMIWSLHKAGPPSAKDISTRVCTAQSMTDCGTPLPTAPLLVNPRLPIGPLYVGYFQAWSSPWTGVGANMDLANIPSYVNVVVVAFAKPDCTYTKGSYSLWPSTGVSFSSDGTVVRDAISTLKARHPNTRVLLAVGGATYTNFAGLNVQCLKDVVTDFGFDGIDLDWEPSSPSCSISGGKVTCPTDTESVNAVTALRTAFPKGQYILSAASFHVGCYGEGTYAASQPITSYTGINLAMARSTAGQALDLVNLMSYDAGNLQTTGYDPKEAYRATSAAWPNAAVALGVEVPPEGGGSTNVITLAQVDDYATYVKSQGGAGMMIWSLHKAGPPSAKDISTRVCTAQSMTDCGTPLPV